METMVKDAKRLVLSGDWRGLGATGSDLPPDRTPPSHHGNGSDCDEALTIPRYCKASSPEDSIWLVPELDNAGR
jgi:hypothetical protein